VTRLLVVTALDIEATSLACHLGLGRVAATPWPHFRAGALEIAVVGLRAHSLSARADAVGEADLVISAGVCGALSPDLARGDLVVPETVLGPDGRLWPTTAIDGLRRRGQIIAVDRVVSTVAEKSRLWLTTGATAVDMESAAILEWAEARGIPAAVIRAVSDTAAHAVAADLATIVATDGAVRTLRAVRTLLARPTALADALALRAGTASALQTVATTLARLTPTLTLRTSPPRQ
jgi:adenosylhomocysteine nucleosidase